MLRQLWRRVKPKKMSTKDAKVSTFKRTMTLLKEEKEKCGDIAENSEISDLKIEKKSY